ncbi:MAG: FAD-dependent oxidoreductase [Clostridiales bacterium]|jgi:thioredoxin reductase (NADPH)|nr:FAD-dependent oxidoreductase [Clostridiales bacterium]
MEKYGKEPKAETVIYDSIIIGAGTAGITSAVYLRRAGKTVLIFEKQAVGGQIVFSHKIENYPGIKSISGGDYADALYEQASALGAELAFKAVTDLSVCPSKSGIDKPGIFKITADGKEYFAKSVVIAAGLRHKKLGLPEESALAGLGVSYCALCDGAFFKNQTAAVVGGGNTALSDALFLSSVCKKVYLIHRRGTFRGEERLVKSLSHKPNVEFILHSEVKELSGGQSLTAIRIFNNNSGEYSELKTDALFVAIGQKPSNSCFGGLVGLDDDGFIITQQACNTKTDGLFAAGDCRQKQIRQLVTAAADGAIAAVGVVEYLNRLDGD